jgi:SAM-dependent methyltransferase
MQPTTDGWPESAEAWIAEQGEHGDYARQFVLDAPMHARIARMRPADALDIGCGEGRFVRQLTRAGVRAVGIDPTPELLAVACARDPQGTYLHATAEHLPFAAGSFDLALFYLSLIDIPDIAAAIAEAVRVLRPGGSILVANLTSFNTAGPPQGWTIFPDGVRRFCIDNYLDERADWVSWRGVRIRNWHRPMATYMRLFLEHGLILRHFDEPAPHGGTQERIALHRRVPYFLIMEWQKP